MLWFGCSLLISQEGSCYPGLYSKGQTFDKKVMEHAMDYNIQGVPEKASHFQNEITQEMWAHEVHFRCFWNAEMYIVTFLIRNI